jgi:ATP-dependent Lon protease
MQVFKFDSVDSVQDNWGANDRHDSYYEQMKRNDGLRKLVQYPKNLAKRLHKLKTKYPNFSELFLQIEQMASLAAFKDNVIDLSPLMLDGPPGIGKSSVVRELAICLELPYLEISVGTLQSCAKLVGSDKAWNNSTPGDILSFLARHDVANPIILLDEIDKYPINPQWPIVPALLSLLEQDQASKFRDLCFSDIETNLSKVVWIATSNDARNINDTLQSRLLKISVEQPNPKLYAQTLKVMYRDLLSEKGLKSHFSNSLTSNVINRLIDVEPRQAKKLFSQALGSAAMKGRQSLLNTDFPQPEQNNSRGIGFLATL